MENIITEIAGKFISNLLEIIVAGGVLAQIEEGFLRESKACAARLVGAYAEKVDAEIVSDRSARREAGYRVERRGDERRIQTMLGEVSYRRTYFQKVSGGYEYLADTVLGVDKRERVSSGLSLSLVRAAKDMSYAKSSFYLTDGTISRQTVMGKLRQSYSQKPIAGSRRQVAELHIDADEDHVTMVGGRKSIVPLISIYEGIDKHGKRGACRNVFHISEYGKSSEALWEQALTEVESRYDLDGTRIYLHGDGADWIKTGLEWFPGAIFVLDKHHKNKAITSMTAGLSPPGRVLFNTVIRRVLSSGDTVSFDRITAGVCESLPGRTDKILQNAAYLKTHIAGISICAKDPSANNGGCTEPHVSHILSSRLSSRPMVWSKRTLKQFAPMLAGGDVCKTPQPTTTSLPTPLRKAAAKAKRAFRNGTAGLPAPSAIGALPLSGKVTGTQILLKRFA